MRSGGRTYDGPRHFDYKPSRTEDIAGVWDSAEANRRTYLLLKQRAAAFRSDPQVRAAIEASRVDELRRSTLDDGETMADLLADRSAYEDFDPDAAATRGFGFVALNQLAVEHVLGRPVVPKPHIAGVDSSTQSCKVVIRDAETGALIREARASHPDRTEVHPEAWWAALTSALRDVGGLDDVASVRRSSAARHDLPRRVGRRRPPGAAVERHPFRRRRGGPCRPVGSRSVGRGGRKRTGRLVHNHQIALAGRA